jgi:putative ABC transport system substrate-binding protein
VIVADSTQAAVSAKKATTAIPIVAISEDPVGSGLVGSLARPGGNITGLSSLPREPGAKQLELLKKAVPRVTRVAVLADPANPTRHLVAGAMEASARVLGLQRVPLDVSRSPDYESAFATMAEMPADAVIHTLGRWDESATSPARRLSQLAMKHRLPAIFASRDFVVPGGLMSYGPDSADLFARAAACVAKILKGARPADLPVEQPIRFELVLNLKTAGQLGLTIPRKVSVRADEVIE